MRDEGCLRPHPWDSREPFEPKGEWRRAHRAQGGFDRAFRWKLEVLLQMTALWEERQAQAKCRRCVQLRYQSGRLLPDFQGELLEGPIEVAQGLRCASAVLGGVKDNVHGAGSRSEDLNGHTVERRLLGRLTENVPRLVLGDADTYERRVQINIDVV